MVDITNFHKSDTASRTQTTIVEETNYTVTWADLTGEGFADGDELVCMTELSPPNLRRHVRRGFEEGAGLEISAAA